MEIGEFEYLVLAAASKLGGDAYGGSIRQDVERSLERECSIGALYTTLDRLERKGLVHTSMGEATPQRGGRPKRMVRITPTGIRVAREFHRAIATASAGTVWQAA